MLATISSAHLVSLNVGPIGLVGSLAALVPILAVRPMAVLVQEAHVPHAQLKSVRMQLHKHFPAYCLFANRHKKSTSKIDVVTLVHIKMASRASLLDIRAQFQVASIREQAPEALTKVHFLRLLDPTGQVSILLGNVHNFQAGQHSQQTALLALVKQVVDRWGPQSDHVIVGGDWNATLLAREGYAEDSVTKVADARLTTWSQAMGWCYIATGNCTWSDGTRRATLDAFFAKDKESIREASCIESTDPRHDHHGVRVILPDERIGPMPELESLRRPVRLKLKGLRVPATRETYMRLVKEKAELASQETQGFHNVFERLSQIKGAVLGAAREALGTTGGLIRPRMPKQSHAFKKVAARIRLLRVVREELVRRREESVSKPSSSAMIKVWHELQDVYPEGTTFRELAALAADGSWSRRAVAGLRAHIHTAGEELRRLRRAELRDDMAKQRTAEIEDLLSGGGLRRFLHPPSPSLHSPILRADIVHSVSLEGSETALDSVARIERFNIVRDGPNRLTVTLTSTEELAALLTTVERAEARVRGLDMKTAYVTDRRERMAQWERSLGNAAGATLQQCQHCRSKNLRFIPRNSKPNTCWWCGECSRFSIPVVEKSEYSRIPFDTNGIPKMPAGVTLRGPITREDLDWYLGTLRNGRAPGPDEVPYELLKLAPEKLKHSLHECINAILVDGNAPPAEWLGGLVRFLLKPGGDLLDPSAYRPVCLLPTVYKILSAIIKDRLYRLCEQHGLLESSQEGFRKLRCTQRQVQSLHWAIEEAAEKGTPLYIAYLDFENAFNSVDHEAVWRWLTELNIPDVDLIRSLYEGAHYEADLPYGRSAPVYLSRGTKQGDILSPLLFGLIFNAVLIGLRQSGVGHRTIGGVQSTNRGFADDLVLSTATPAGMQKLLQVVADFCNWSGMRVKLQKSVITAFDFGSRSKLPTDQLRYNGYALVNLAPDESFKYLGVRTALTKSLNARPGSCPCTKDEIDFVHRSTKELTSMLAEHQKPLSSIVPFMRMVATARFRYSAALVPWTDAALEELFKTWIQVERAAWKLQRSFPSAQFILPTEAGGVSLEHPRVVLIQALSTHVRQLVALPDSIRDTTINSYKRLCKNCGCLNERELAQYLATEKKPRSNPIARLLRACGQLQIDIKLPDCLSAGKSAREVSWFAFLNHVQSRVAADDADGQRDLRCVSHHWPTIQKRLRGRGIHYPRQLILDPQAQEVQWLLPEQMKNNPGWLKPLKRMVHRADVTVMFRRLDRGTGTPDQSAHQVLISELLRSLKYNERHDQRLPADILADARWSKVRSSAPMGCWVKHLERQRLQPPAVERVERGRAIVQMLIAIGKKEQTHTTLLRNLCLWVAPTLYTVGGHSNVESLGAPFATHSPLRRELVVFQFQSKDSTDKVVRQIGEFRVGLAGGVTRIDREDGRHIGTVNQGRWNLLAETYEELDLIRALPGWITEVEAEERTRGVPSHQLWRGICQAFQADSILGCNPLVAPSCFDIALRGGAEEGWGHRKPQTRVVHNLLSLSAQEIIATVSRLRRHDSWLALTRSRTLTAVAEERLRLVGTRVHVWLKGSLAAAGSGIWRKAQIHSVQTKEDWTVWANAQTAELSGSALRQALCKIRLTKDGVVPLHVDCPSFREALLGPAGEGLNYPGTILATDGSVKEDGSMGAAYVALGNSIPARSFVVLGPPSAMRAELSGLDQAIVDAPLEEDLTLLTDSLSSIVKLMNMQRIDFPEWLYGHPERALLESVVRRINERSRAQVITRIIKVPAHKAHPLNEAADALASAAAEVADSELVALCHADCGAVRFYLNGKLTEWGAQVRKHLIHTAAQQRAEHLRQEMTWQAKSNENGDGGGGQNRGRTVSLSAKWLLRPTQGRRYLGAILAGMRNGARKRRLLQSIAGMFPCRALLYKWGTAKSPACLLCDGAAESLAHVQCWCPALKEARIAAHHAVANTIFTRLRKHTQGRWHIFTETPVSSLRAIDVPLDLYNTWNRMVDELEEWVSENNTSGGDRQPRLGRLRPDAWAVSWSKRQVLILELTRAYDWRQDWYITTDQTKVQRYLLLQEQMQDLLPQGWRVETVPLTVGIRGSFDEESWRQTLSRFKMHEDDQDKFMHAVIRQVLEELDLLYGVRSEALRKLQDG